MQQKPTFIFIKNFFGFLVFLLGGIMLINYACDPIQYIRRSPGKTLVSNQRLQVAGFVKTFDYNLLVAGNSRTEALPNKIIKEMIPGAMPITLVMPGSNIVEQIIPLKKALATGKVKTVIWGIPPSALHYSGHSLPPAFPKFLYDDHIIQYLFNFRVFQFSFKNLFKSQKLSDAEILDNYRKKEDKFTFAKEIMLQLYKQALSPKKTPCPVEINYAHAILAEKNFTDDVLPILQQYPHVKFYIFLPPQSLAFYKLSYHNDCNGFENNIRIRTFMFQHLTALPNVQVYDFETDMGIVGNLENYQDLMHYRQAVKDDIVTRMKDNINLVTPDNMSEKNRRLRQQVLLPLE